MKAIRMASAAGVKIAMGTDMLRPTRTRDLRRLPRDRVDGPGRDVTARPSRDHPDRPNCAKSDKLGSVTPGSSRTYRDAGSP